MKTLLFVDDNKDTLYSIREALQDEYKIITTNEPGSVFEKITKTKPDIAFLDIMMPNINGWSIAEKLKEKSQIPIVFLSALTDEKTIEKCGRYGHYLEKPFFISDIRNLIKELT